MDSEQIVPLDLGVVPESAVSGAVLLQSEEAAYLVFHAMREMPGEGDAGNTPRLVEAGTARIELVGCSITKFGYPNDEAWGSIPRTKDLECGIYEVRGSAWRRELLELNRHGFPGSKENSSRHFLLLFHDSSFECIVSELRLQLFEFSVHQVAIDVCETKLGD